MIRCLVDLRNAPGSPRYVVDIAKCESGDDLVAGIDRYAGTFQHLTSKWPERVEAFASWARIRMRKLLDRYGDWREEGVPSPLVVRLNTAVAIWMARNDGTWSKQWSCA